METRSREFTTGAFSSLQRVLGFSLFFSLFAALNLPRSALAVLALAVGLSVMMLLPSRLIVGSDGIVLKWLCVRRFVPFAAIAHVSFRNTFSEKHSLKAIGFELVIDLFEGKPIRVTPGPAGHSVFDAIVERRRAHRARTVRFDAHVLRPAGTDDGEEWLARLRRLTDRVQSFRVDAPSREDLFGIVEDPLFDEEARAAAAVVVSADKNDEALHRLRIARDATVSPKLRLVIEAAIESPRDSEDAIGEALENVRRSR